MILLFGRLRDLVPEGALEGLALPQSFTYAQLVDMLEAVSPVLVEAICEPGVKLAVNQAFVDKTEALILKAEDEIAFLPPLSGG